jgi:hypothetical protein
MVNSNLDNVPEWKTVQLVFVVDQFLKRSKSGSIWGTIYFQIADSEVFPDRGWTDMVGAFLRNWLDALISVAEGVAQKEESPFFDGPLSVHISSLDKNVVQLTFVRYEDTKNSAVATIGDLLRNAIAVAEEFLGVCGHQGWSNGDTEAVAVLSKQAARTVSERTFWN